MGALKLLCRGGSNSNISRSLVMMDLLRCKIEFIPPTFRKFVLKLSAEDFPAYILVFSGRGLVVGALIRRGAKTKEGVK